ncbi:hypothetical protein SLA2020_149580 [Shorea laevis]
MKKIREKSALMPELVTDILLRLPVSSLLRFRCLSRPVCSEIDSEKFVKNHLNSSIKRRTRLKLIFFDSVLKGPSDLYYSDFDDDLVVAFVLNKPLISPYQASFVYGSCNGLILLGWDLAVWNPFTRRYKKLPLCPVQTLPGYKGFMCSGLGYDSAHDDYMILLISEVHDSDRLVYQVWIFGLKSDIWRRSRDLKDDVNTQVGHFANGALYWACKRKNKCVGFDLAKEVFFDIPLLSDCRPASIFWDSLVVFGGNVYCPTLHDGTVEYYLLVSEDKGGDVVEVSWRKEFTMENVKTIMDDVFPPWPLAYSKDRNSILLGEVGGVFWHNLENRTKQRVNIAGQPEVRGFRYNVCWESLVSVGKDSAFEGAAEGVRIDDLE